jgi:hypothetical protein
MRPYRSSERTVSNPMWARSSGGGVKATRNPNGISNAGVAHALTYRSAVVPGPRAISWNTLSRFQSNLRVN